MSYELYELEPIVVDGQWVPPSERLRKRPDVPWNPELHPRILHGHGGGEFTSGTNAATGKVEHHEKYAHGTGTKADPVRTNDPAEAAKALGEDKHVELESYRQVSTLLDKLGGIVDDAKEKGESAPNYDLCKVSVPGTNLFCAQSKGIPRVMMPQLKAKPLPGSKADKLPKDSKGEVDLGPAFVEYMKSKHNVEVHSDDVDPSVLKASQNQLNGGKVAGMAKAMEAGKIPPSPIFVTQDDYIVDGHHRWAAQVALEIKKGDVPPMPVTVIQADILPVLAWANMFALDQGIPTAAVGAPSGGVVPAKRDLAYYQNRRFRSRDCTTCGPPEDTERNLTHFAEYLHPRRPDGEWANKLAGIHPSLADPSLAEPRHPHGSPGGALAMHASSHDRPLPSDQEEARWGLRALQAKYHEQGVHLDQSKHALEALARDDYVTALRHFHELIDQLTKRGQPGASHPVKPPAPKYEEGFESTDTYGTWAGA